MKTRFVHKITKRIGGGYLTAFILLLCSYILSFYGSQQISNQQEWVKHTNVVIKMLDNLLSEVKDGETSVRGYVIMKDESILNDYYKTPQRTDSILNDLRSETVDNPTQQKTLDTLETDIKNKLQLLATGLVLFKKGFVVTDSMKVIGNQAIKLMKDIKITVGKMQNEENNLLITRTTHVATASNFIKIINIISLVIAIVLVYYSIISFNKENAARQTADRSAASFREQLEQRVQELNKLNIQLLELRGMEKFAATGRIARTIAHEVRNPLTNINLATEHLRSEIPAGNETELLFGMITRNCNRINELISDLLNSTRGAQLTFEKIRVDEILDDSIHLAHDRIELKKVTVTKKYDPQLPFILADPEKLKIAFLNIIVNAIEAMEEGKGVLEITTKTKNDRCVVTITDNGIGMDSDSLSKLFEPYFTTKLKGTGLGLTNTQNIILSHSATVYAESEEGKGTSFIITFNYA